MVKLYDTGAYLVNGTTLVPEAEAARVEAMTGKKVTKEEARKGTIAYGIMEAHNTSGNMQNLKLKFDAMTYHVCRYHSDGKSVRNGKISNSVCADQLP